MSWPSELNEKVATDVGLFVQSVAIMELALDDLMGLANARFDASKFVSRRYPVQLSEKIKCLPKIASLVAYELRHEAREEHLEKALSLRHYLVHGKIIQIRHKNVGYEFDVIKMGIPEKEGQRQKLRREVRHFTSVEFFDRTIEIKKFKDELEELRKRVFEAGEGWPTYLPENGDDPLGASDLSDWMAKYQPINVDRR